MLNVSVDVKSDCIDVSWEWVGSDAGPPEPPGYLIKWGAKEEQVKADVRTFNIPVDDETALLVTLQTMGEHTLEYETLVKLRCVNIDKQKEEALILIMVSISKRTVLPLFTLFLASKSRTDARYCADSARCRRKRKRDFIL